MMDNIAYLAHSAYASHRGVAYQFACLLFLATYVVLKSKSSRAAHARRREEISRLETNFQKLCAQLNDQNSKPSVSSIESPVLNSNVSVAVSSAPRTMSVEVQSSLVTNMATSQDDQLVGWRLNSYANMKNIDFERDFLSKFTPAEQAIYKKFAPIADNAMREFEASGQIDRSRFYQLPDDFTKLRYLKADKFNEKDAIARMKHVVSWRQKIGLDDFITNPDMDLYRRYQAIRPREYIGNDRFGRPVMLERMGEFFTSTDAYKAISEHDFDLVTAYIIQELQAKCREVMDLPERPAYLDASVPFPFFNTTFIYVGDLQGVSLLNTARKIGFLRRIAAILSVNFPECAGPLTLIHAPKAAVNLYNKIAKPFLDPVTAAKIEMQYDEQGTKLVAERIGLHVVPKEFGGNLEFNLQHVPKSIDAEFNAKYPYDPSKHAPKKGA